MVVTPLDPSVPQSLGADEATPVVVSPSVPICLSEKLVSTSEIRELMKNCYDRQRSFKKQNN